MPDENVDNETTRNLYGRRISECLPSGVERALYEISRKNVIDALISRILEGAVPETRRNGFEGAAPSGEAQVNLKSHSRFGYQKDNRPVIEGYLTHLELHIGQIREQ